MALKAPQGYKLLGGTRAEFSVGENQPTVTVPDMALQPGEQVEILVVDRDGKPQPQAEIYNGGFQSGFHARFFNSLFVRLVNMFLSDRSQTCAPARQAGRGRGCSRSSSSR